MGLNVTSFCRSGRIAAWELTREGESLNGGCQGGASRCGKLRQIISAPQGGYISAILFLAVEFIIAKLCRGTTVFAGPLLLEIVSWSAGRGSAAL